MRSRGRRHVRRPPDLTSLFDVLFIVVFVALIRAAAAQQEVKRLTPPPAPPKPATPAPPLPPPDVAALRAKALSSLDRELAARTPIVVRIATHVEGDRMRPTLATLELEGQKLPLDVPLLADSHDPDLEAEYQGDSSAELRACRLAAVHLRLPDLARHLVILVPDRPQAELERAPGSRALLRGLRADVARCYTDQRGIAVLVDPAELAPPAAPAPAAPATAPPAAPSPP